MSIEQWLSLLAPIILALVTGVITIYKDRPEAISHAQLALSEVQQAEALAERTKFETINLLIDTLREQIKTMSIEQKLIKEELRMECEEAEKQYEDYRKKERDQQEFFEKSIDQLRREQYKEILILKEELNECLEHLRLALENVEKEERDRGKKDGGI